MHNPTVWAAVRNQSDTWPGNSTAIPVQWKGRSSDGKREICCRNRWNLRWVLSQRAKHIHRVKSRHLPAWAKWSALWFLKEWEERGKEHFFSSWLRLLKPIKFLLLTSMQPNRVGWCMWTCKCHSWDCEVHLMKDSKSVLEAIYRQVHNQRPGSAHSQSLGKFRSNLNFVVSGMHKPNQPQLQPM